MDALGFCHGRRANLEMYALGSTYPTPLRVECRDFQEAMLRHDTLGAAFELPKLSTNILGFMQMPQARLQYAWSKPKKPIGRQTSYYKNGTSGYHL